MRHDVKEELRDLGLSQVCWEMERRPSVVAESPDELRVLREELLNSLYVPNEAASKMSGVVRLAIRSAMSVAPCLHRDHEGKELLPQVPIERARVIVRESSDRGAISRLNDCFEGMPLPGSRHDRLSRGIRSWPGFQSLGNRQNETFLPDERREPPG